MRTTQSNIVEGIQQTHDAHKAKLLDIVKNVYWMAKKCIPLSRIKSLCDLDKLKGNILGKTYINKQAARDFLMPIAHVIQEKIISSAKIKPVMGLQINESTDVWHTSQMVIYLRL